MCNCGRKRQSVVTSAQAAQQTQQDQIEAADAMRELAMQTVTEAEKMLASAANAARNARS